jgi:hypothetical protein
MKDPRGSSRTIEGLGPVPEHIPPEDTEPTLFETPDVTPVVCSLCRRSPFDTDDAFERGIDYAMVVTQGLLKPFMHHDEAQGIVDFLRERIKNP